jgi:hypothetical protein
MRRFTTNTYKPWQVQSWWVASLTGAKLLLLGLILVLGTFAVIGPISAQPVISISNTGNIEVIAGQSNHNSIQFSVPEGLEVNSVTISCSCLPSGQPAPPIPLASRGHSPMATPSKSSSTHPHPHLPEPTRSPWKSSSRSPCRALA